MQGTKRLENCKLYLVTDRSLFDDLDTFYDAVASALAGGVDILQLREKTATAKEFIEIAKTLKHLCGLNDTIFIINDRVDIAQAVKADGVQLGQNDIDIHTARNLLGNEAIIGLSTHKPEDAKHQITTSGIRTDGKLYEWEKLTNFWLKKEWDQEVIICKTLAALPGVILLVLDPSKRESIIKEIGEKIPLVKPTDSFVDKASKWLGNKIPLETT